MKKPLWYEKLECWVEGESLPLKEPAAHEDNRSSVKAETESGKLGPSLLRGLGWASAKILLILAFQWLTSPVSTHRISKAELMSNPHYDKHCEVK